MSKIDSDLLATAHDPAARLANGPPHTARPARPGARAPEV
jgi:hypothetical protein